MTLVTNAPPTSRRSPFVLLFLAVFLLPIAARAALFAFDDTRPRSYADADWSSMHSLPAARDFPEARVFVMSGRTGEPRSSHATSPCC